MRREESDKPTWRAQSGECRAEPTPNPKEIRRWESVAERISGPCFAYFAYFAVKVISLRSLWAFVARIPVRRLGRVFRIVRGDSHSQCGMMLARARADCVGKVVLNGDAVDPGRRSMTHLPWATIGRPYGTFSLCCAEVDCGFCALWCLLVANPSIYGETTR